MKRTCLALAVSALVALSMPLAAAAQTTAEPTQQPTCDDPSNCPAARDQQQVEVAGVQTSPDDARMPGETEDFIINDGFGD